MSRLEKMLARAREDWSFVKAIVGHELEQLYKVIRSAGKNFSNMSTAQKAACLFAAGVPAYAFVMPGCGDGGGGGGNGGNGNGPTNKTPYVVEAIAPVSIPEDTSTAVDVAGNFADSDNDALTYYVSGFTDISAVLSGTDINISAPLNYNGTETGSVKACDPSNACVSTPLEVIFTPVNDAPSIDGATMYLSLEGSLLDGIVNTSDVDGDTVTCSLADNGGLTELIINPDCTITSSAPLGDIAAGPYNISVDAYDGTTTTNGNIVINITHTIRGVHTTSWWYTDYFMPELDLTLEEMCELGVESFSALATWYQDTATSTDIAPNIIKTPMDSGIETMIAKTEALGRVTVLKPHVDLMDGDYRGNINFGNDKAKWTAWFASYNNFIMHYAQLAEANGVDVLVIGTELEGTVHRAEWNDIIDNIRSVYSGKIVYGANWDNYQNVSFWDKVDYIGVDAYFPLTASFNPTPAELDAAWQGVVQELENFSNLHGKKLIITEIGYQSYDGTNKTPWWAPTGVLDEQEQADCYRAALNNLSNKDFIAAIWIWHTHWDMQDLDRFGFIGKLAEGEVNYSYHLMD